MGFETAVLSAVRDVARHAQTEFANGTLFIANTDRTEVNMISEFLQSHIRCGQRIAEGPDGYFSIDFTNEL